MLVFAIGRVPVAVVAQLLIWHRLASVITQAVARSVADCFSVALRGFTSPTRPLSRSLLLVVLTSRSNHEF